MLKDVAFYVKKSSANGNQTIADFSTKVVWPAPAAGIFLDIC
jgi:hypothetical protein